MSRESVRVGDEEPLEFEWVVNFGTDEERPTGAEVRVYYVQNGTKYFYDGSGWVTADTKLPGTFSNGVWKGTFVYPEDTLGKEVFFEARPTGLDMIAHEYIIDSRIVEAYEPTDIMNLLLSPTAKHGKLR